MIINKVKKNCRVFQVFLCRRTCHLSAAINIFSVVKIVLKKERMIHSSTASKSEIGNCCNPMRFIPLKMKREEVCFIVFSISHLSPRACLLAKEMYIFERKKWTENIGEKNIYKFWGFDLAPRFLRVLTVHITEYDISCLYLFISSKKLGWKECR